MARKLPSFQNASWLQNPSLQKFLLAVENAGGEAKVVGGAVRNYLLGTAVSDIDLATTLTTDKVIRLCKDNKFACHETGIAHGTVTVVVEHQAFEVTTLRRDVATDGRRAKVEVTDNWQEDALRRDFTMNALYCDRLGNITDVTNGYHDLMIKKVKFVGTPSKRIAEDHLRILRFFRFHAHYGKGSIDANGLKASTAARGAIKKLSRERVTQELLKLLAAPKPHLVLKAMAQHDILKHILPHTQHWRTISRLPPDSILRLHALAKSPHDLDKYLRLTNQQQDRLLQISHAAPLSPNMSDAELRHMLYRLGAEVFTDRAMLSFASSAAKAKDENWERLLNFATTWQPPKFILKGQDLIEQGLKPSPALGAALSTLEDWWIASDFKATREELLSRLHA